MIELTQHVTVVYSVRYSREEAIKLLTLAAANKEWAEKDYVLMTDTELGSLVADIANRYGDSGLYERLTDDAGDWEDTSDVGDWQWRVIEK